jgi:hypothetical protein
VAEVLKDDVAEMQLDAVAKTTQFLEEKLQVIRGSRALVEHLIDFHSLHPSSRTYFFNPYWDNALG